MGEGKRMRKRLVLLKDDVGCSDKKGSEKKHSHLEIALYCEWNLKEKQVREWCRIRKPEVSSQSISILSTAVEPFIHIQMKT